MTEPVYINLLSTCTPSIFNDEELTLQTLFTIFNKLVFVRWPDELTCVYNVQYWDADVNVYHFNCLFDPSSKSSVDFLDMVSTPQCTSNAINQYQCTSNAIIQY